MKSRSCKRSILSSEAVGLTLQPQLVLRDLVVVALGKFLARSQINQSFGQRAAKSNFEPMSLKNSLFLAVHLGLLT